MLHNGTLSAGGLHNLCSLGSKSAELQTSLRRLYIRYEPARLPIIESGLDGARATNWRAFRNWESLLASLTQAGTQASGRSEILGLVVVGHFISCKKTEKIHRNQDASDHAK